MASQGFKFSSHNSIILINLSLIYYIIDFDTSKGEFYMLYVRLLQNYQNPHLDYFICFIFISNVIALKFQIYIYIYIWEV